MTNTVAVGHGAHVIASSVRWILPLEGNAAKRLRKDREAQHRAVDATRGHSASSIIGLDTGEIVISSVSTEALRGRINKKQTHRQSNWEGEMS